MKYNKLFPAAAALMIAAATVFPVSAASSKNNNTKTIPIKTITSCSQLCNNTSGLLKMFGLNDQKIFDLLGCGSVSCTNKENKASQIIKQETGNTDQKPADTNKTTPKSQNEEFSVNAQEKEVLEIVNRYRTQNGLKPLTLNTRLSQLARMKSEDMRNNHYFAHQSPTYGSAFDMMKKYGISYNYAGENIAMGQRTPAQVMEAWMNSAGHRKNILDPNFTQIGIGYVSDGNYWTQMFIS